MIENRNLEKAKRYIGLANRAKYIIFGADNLKGYTHKLYLIMYREDCGKTIEKVIKEFEGTNINIIKLDVENFNYLIEKENCKLFAIKNKGLSEQIISLLK